MTIQVLADTTDEVLCARLAGGDQNALAGLYDRHGAPAFGVAVRITRSREAAEDIVQVAFLKLWRAPRLYSRARGSFRGWFIRLVINLALDDLRRDASRQRLGAAIGRELGTAEPVADPHDEVEARLGAAALGNAIRRLSEAQRQVLELAFFGGQTLPEIAAYTALPVTTVKGRMRLALARLRSELARPDLTVRAGTSMPRDRGGLAGHL
ncbi:MAG: sigma-70 family RNA polymerase sigma factor [Chloroflexota bacterium]